MADSAQTDPPHLRQTHNDLGARVQALTLLERKVPLPEITEVTGVSKAQLYRYRKIAFQRGYNPNVSKIIKLEYVEDAPKSGRPRKVTEGAKDQNA
ncbi:hypothetical protein B7463_g12597, partial [Scytalidium lignicola]